MIRKLKELSENTELDEMLYELPDDNELCNEILRIVGKENVKIKCDETYNSSLYTVFNNTITIGKIKSKFLKPQAIAHECRHSKQNKAIAWANFIISNIFIIGYLITLAISLFTNCLNTKIIILMTMIAFVQWILRTYLEIDAILNSREIAEKYLKQKELLNQEQLGKLDRQYRQINKIGIYIVSISLLLKRGIEIFILIILNVL